MLPHIEAEINKKEKIVVRTVIFFFLLVWCAGFSFNFIFPSLSFLNPLIKKIYSPFCHQFSDRIFNSFGFNFFVCARCTGIYVGAVIASLFLFFYYKEIKININFFLISAVPILLDIIFYSIDIYSYNKISALSTGLLFGSTAFIYILAVFENSFINKEDSY